MATRTAAVIYDKSIFDVASIGDEGRYTFEVRQDSATADGKTADGSDGKGMATADGDEKDKPSMIKIEDAATESGSGKKQESNIVPSLDGPAS